ncbi:hypothetical protein ACIOHS_43615 [Streptomyces sp. NPDC088253]|uniref:hypothetical protein n=1 Tax=Streptomyces sp. NPDC088253 TaxID=3365846 RepID=UPI00382BFDBE
MAAIPPAIAADTIAVAIFCFRVCRTRVLLSSVLRTIRFGVWSCDAQSVVRSDRGVVGHSEDTSGQLKAQRINREFPSSHT